MNIKQASEIARDKLSFFPNPYPWEVNLPQKKIIKQNKNEVMDISTGEVLENTAIISHQTYDPEQFTKVYKGLLKAKYGFKPSTQKVLDFIIDNLPQDVPAVALDLVELTAYFRGLKSDIKLSKNNKIMTRQTFSSALRELQKNDVIRPTGAGGIYYINANLIHNGSRIAFVHIIERAEKNEEQQRLVNAP